MLIFFEEPPPACCGEPARSFLRGGGGHLRVLFGWQRSLMKKQRWTSLSWGWLGERVLALAILLLFGASPAPAVGDDPIAELQATAMAAKSVSWGHWGTAPHRYSAWTSHSNRLIPIYTFGITLESWRQEGSPYASEERLKRLYGVVPKETLQEEAAYFDQTQVYDLQKQAVAAGKKYIILMVFDGMDWQTTQAAAIFASGKVYRQGRGAGLKFQDYAAAPTDYAYFVTSPYASEAQTNSDAQVVVTLGEHRGGYSPERGGWTPWDVPADPDYLISRSRELVHAYTDSAASATSMTSGIKTYNVAVNVDVEGRHVEPIAQWLQREKNFRIGVVTSVPISHATPAAAYANNVERGDYQDLSRDLLGLPSISHREEPLPGVDVLIGAGYGAEAREDGNQGRNFVPGNRYLTAEDLDAIDVERGGQYRVALRSSGKPGRDVLEEAATTAAQRGERLFGFFGVSSGHLPYRTADGQYNPVADARGTERYRLADVEENPTLAECTRAALKVLGRDARPFWLMIEAGDVDWANHANNIDSSIGAVLSGDEAFAEVVAWIEERRAWADAAVIVTADHGHLFFLTDPTILLPR